MNAPATVGGLVDAFVAAVNRGDRATFGELWDERACEYAPGTPPIVGRGQIEQHLTPLFERRRNDLRVDLHEATSDSPWAYCSGMFSFRSTQEDSGVTQYVDGKFLAVAVNNTQGWRLYRLCYNENVAR